MRWERCGVERSTKTFCFLMQNFVDFSFPPVCPSLKPREDAFPNIWNMFCKHREEIRSRVFWWRLRNLCCCVDSRSLPYGETELLLLLMRETEAIKSMNYERSWTETEDFEGKEARENEPNSNLKFWLSDPPLTSSWCFMRRTWCAKQNSAQWTLYNGCSSN